jgi:hypothetical protein
MYYKYEEIIDEIYPDHVEFANEGDVEDFNIEKLLNL